MEDLPESEEPRNVTPLDPRLVERFRPKRVPTLVALRRIVRASDFLDKETLEQMDSPFKRSKED